MKAILIRIFGAIGLFLFGWYAGATIAGTKLLKYERTHISALHNPEYNPYPELESDVIRESLPTKGGFEADELYRQFEQAIGKR